MGNSDQPRGPDGRWIRRGQTWIIVAIALGVALGAGAGPGVVVGGALAGASGSSGAGGSFGGGRTQGGHSTSARGKARDRSTARTTARLARKGLRLRDRGVDSDSDCAAHSYGQVQDFFRSHPCKALFRALFEVRDNRGNLVVLAIAWVDMPDSSQAQQLKQLIDRPGSGNIIELSRQRGGQRFSGNYYRSARDDATVVNVQAEPVGRARTAIELAKVAVNAAI